jgi:hypothetical protein
MRNFLLIAAIGLATTGCGIIYKQPIYQGNLIDQSDVEKLSVGQSKQQVIALLGNTGRSTGPHVHFEVHKQGRVVNPRKFIRAP